MDIKRQWANPAETLDTIIGILTGLPIDETWGTDAIGVASDKMEEIFDLRRQLNEANQTIRELREVAETEKEPRVCPSCLSEGIYLGSDGHKVICEMCDGSGTIYDQ